MSDAADQNSWFNGIPYGGALSSPSTSVTYWFNGVPISMLSGATPAESGVKVFGVSSPFISRRITTNAY